MKEAARVGCVLALLAGCGRQTELEPCDIATPKCQSDVFYAVMRMRGDGWDPFQGVPPIRTIARERFRKELEAAADAGVDAGSDAGADAGSDAGTAQPTPSTEYKPTDPWDATLYLLGLVAPEPRAQQAIDNRVNYVAAQYSPAERKVTVIDDGAPPPEQAAQERLDRTVLLAHELVHAFQERDESLSHGERSTDGVFAEQAFVEGEAVLYEYLTRARFDGAQGLGAYGQARWYESWAEGLLASLPAQRSPWEYANLWLLYPFGARMTTQSWLAGGNAGVRRLGSDYPRHAGEYMAALAHRPPIHAVDLDCRIEAPGKAFKLTGFNHFGAMQFYAFLASRARVTRTPAQGELELHADRFAADRSAATQIAAGANEHAAWRSALDWRGDSLWVYHDADKRDPKVVFSWRVRTADTKSAAAAISAAAWKTLSGVKLARDGEDLAITGSDHPELLSSWSGAHDCTR